MTKGIASLDDVNVVCGGVHRVPDSVRNGPACTKEDITFANLKEENSPFYDGFRQQCADEAVARGIGAWKESESSSTPQLGSYIKVTTPALHLAGTSGDIVGLLYNKRAGGGRYEVMWDSSASCGELS